MERSGRGRSSQRRRGSGVGRGGRGQGGGGNVYGRGRGRGGSGGGGGSGSGGAYGGAGGSSYPPYQQQFQQQNPYVGGCSAGQSGGRGSNPSQQGQRQGSGGGGGRGVGYDGRSGPSASYQQAVEGWNVRPESGRGGDRRSVPAADVRSGQSSGQSGPDLVSCSGRGGLDRGTGSSPWDRGRSYVPVRSQRPPEPVSDTISSEMQALDLSRQVSLSDSGSTSKILPVKRPDVGVNSIRTSRIFVNHYPVKFNPETIIMHYDVDIKEERGDRHRKVSKSDLRMIRKKLLSDDARHHMFMTAYDGEKNIFSVEPLPTGNIQVESSEGEDLRRRSFVMTIKLVNELQVWKLREYLCGQLLFSPRDVLQGMDLVMKENPTRQLISVGRSFFNEEYFPCDDLGRGIAAYRGFQHSLKPTSQGLALCLDYSVLAFRKKLSVIDFLNEHIPKFDLNAFGSFRIKVEEALRGLKVTVTHRRTKQKYTIAGLTEENTRFINFTAEDPDGVDAPREISLLDYFREKYRIEIREINIPCLNVGKNNRKNYVPMELCVLVEGQVFPKDNLDTDAGKLLKHISLADPNHRRNSIQGMVQSEDGPCGGGIAEHFGMEIDMSMTVVKGRVIGPPGLKLGALGGRTNMIKVDPAKCHWNLVRKSVVEGKRFDRWAVLDFSASDRRKRLNPDCFIPALIDRCRNLGIQMEEPLYYEPAGMRVFSNIRQLQELLKFASEKKGPLQLLLCVMAKKDHGYKHLKWFSETQIGMVTQCCLSDEANKIKDQTLANLALKINAKLGGSNSELVDRFPRFEEENHVMFVGADVNHPAANNVTSPSIAAVVATMNWPAANRYAARVCPQTHRKEQIINFGDMCSDLVDAYATANGIKPARIVVFRDGVSEGQFEMVLNEELMDLKRAFQTKNYCPTITLIVARKRHQTRLFPASLKDGSETGNVQPGTVVDTTIVHPFEFDFYLCSHYGSMGTSKPTHYHVLWDEHHFTSDQLQQLIYNLCFTFARCTKPVSLVPPVYYADLVAYRGRLYYDALTERPTTVAQPSFGESMFKVHGDIKNAMFFV